MKPTNRFYAGSPPDPDDDPVIRCTFCNVPWHSCTWRASNGKCPGCHKPYAGPKNED